MSDILNIRAHASRHGIEFLLVGGIGLTFIMLFNLLRPGEISIIEIFLASSCIAAIFIGYLKTQEPYFSFTFCEDALIYRHKVGYWQLNRENFHHSGIPKVEQGHLFERFFRAQNAMNLKGTGLGLNIVKRYIDLMDGKISFESEENQGTTFFVELPLH